MKQSKPSPPAHNGGRADDWVKLVAAGVDPIEAARKVGYKRPERSARANLRTPSVVERLEAAKSQVPGLPLPAARFVDEVQDRRNQAYEMWLQGHTLEEVASSVGVAKSTCWQDIRWMMRELARLDGLEPLKELRQQITEELLVEVELGHIGELEARRAGDHRAAAVYHANRLKAWAEIARINGLDPKKVELSGPGGGPIQLQPSPPDLSRLSDEELWTLRDLQRKARPTQEAGGR